MSLSLSLSLSLIQAQFARAASFRAGASLLRQSFIQHSGPFSFGSDRNKWSGPREKELLSSGKQQGVLKAV